MSPYHYIFLADDDSDDREIFLSALTAIDPTFELFTARNGEEAVQILSGDFFQKPDIIFLDMNMPLLTGKQVLSRIKSIDGVKNIPVVMYSTHFTRQDVEDTKTMGAVNHLVKPTTFATLISLLTSTLQQKW